MHILLDACGSSVGCSWVLCCPTVACGLHTCHHHGIDVQEAASQHDGTDKRLFLPLPGAQVKTYRAPAFLAAHWVNAFESDDGRQLHLDAVAAQSPALMSQWELERGEQAGSPGAGNLGAGFATAAASLHYCPVLAFAQTGGHSWPSWGWVRGTGGQHSGSICPCATDVS